MSDKILTLREAIAIASIIDAAQRGVRVAKLHDDGHVTYGVARSIGGNADSGFPFARNDQDVRDLYLRVSGTMEYAWSIADMVDKIGVTYFLDVSK